MSGLLYTEAAYHVANVQVLECNPDALHERTKATPEEGYLLRFDVSSGSLERVSRAFEVVRSARVLLASHLGLREMVVVE